MDAAEQRATGGGGLWNFIKERKFWILAPLVLIVLMVGLLVLLSGDSSALNPWSYNLF